MIKQAIHISKIILLLFLIFVLGIFVYFNFKGDDIYLEGETIIFKGKITPASYTQFTNIYNSAKVKPTTLIVTSEGGDMTAGLDFGYFIHTNQLNIRVRGYCFSSCGNYMFFAAKEKIIEADSFVGWHGSAIQANLADSSWKKEYPCEAEGTCNKQIAEFENKLSNDTKRQAELFLAIGIDEQITIYGQDIGCDCSWTFSIEDMHTFGVTGIKFEGDEYFSDLSWSAKQLVEDTNTKLLKVQSANY